MTKDGFSLFLLLPDPRPHTPDPSSSRPLDDLRALQGRVFAPIVFKSTHPVGRITPPPLSRGDLDQKRIGSVFECLLGGRRTEDVFCSSRSYQTLDPKPVTPLFTKHQSLFTIHQPPLFAREAELAAEGNWHREAILACVSRLAGLRR